MHYRIESIVLSVLVGCLMTLSCGKKSHRPPETRVENITEIHHDVEVRDPYRWLENWETPEVRSWNEDQNRYARRYLKHLPSVKAIEKRIGEIIRSASVSYYSLMWNGKYLFAMKYDPQKNQPLLVALSSPDAPESERIILDANTFDPTSGTTIDWYYPSPDGRLVAVSMSKGGSESGDLYLFDTELGERIDEIIPRVNGGTAGGDLAWLPDGSGFYYTKYPSPGERSAADLPFYQQVWFHRLNTSVRSDRRIIGDEFPRIAEIGLAIDKETSNLLVTLQYGDSHRFSHFLIRPDGSIEQFSEFDDGIVQAIFGPEGTIYLISKHGAPRGKIQRLQSERLNLKRAKTIIPEDEHTVMSSFSGKSRFVVTASRLYVTYQTGGPSEIRVYDLQGRPLPGPEILPVSSISELTPWEDENLLFRNTSYIEPAAWYHFDPASGETRKTALFNTSSVDFSDTEVIREHAISGDGTRIPVSILRKKGIELDGSHPTLLTGYGGFGASRSPGFSAITRLWIEQGGVYAVANIRGGGEFGKVWHDAGKLTNKQNCFNDFAATMQYLIDAGYTTPANLAIRGGSNGGLLMGAMITQQPGLFNATVSTVGIYDMIRVELTPNGAFNIPEYGTVKNENHFKAMFAYSPYHNVRDGTAYPAILFMTGANDPRVDPMHSRKMTARLQVSTDSEAPILLRTSSDTGHGRGTPTDALIEELTDQYAFLFAALGVKYKRFQ